MKTIEVIDAPTNTNEAQIPVRNGEREKSDIDARRLRMMAEKVFGAVVNNMDDEGLQKYVKAGVQGDIEAQYNKLMHKELTEANPGFAKKFESATEALAQDDPEEEVSHEAVDSIGAPTGFPETSDIEKELDEVGPVTTSLRSRIMNNLNRSIIFAYGKMYDRSAKYTEFFRNLSAEEQDKYKTKVNRRATLAAAFGAAAIYGITKMNPIDMAFGGVGTSARTVDADEYGGIANASRTVELTTEGNAPDAEKPVFGTRTFEANDFAYNPAEDPALSPAKKGNDFGPELRGLPNDEAMKWPSGLSDLINDRWINSPEEFATVMSKLGLVDNNADAINSLGEKMKASPELYHENYAKVMEKLAKADISEQAITSPYGSYYAVNAGGNAVIAYDNYVDHGGTAIVIKVDGKEVWLRKECGGQAIDLKPHTPSQPAPAAPVRTSTPSQPVYVTPPTPEVPVTPEEPTPPTPPIPPVTPPIPPIPPIEPPLPPIVPPKNPLEDINVNPLLPEQIQMGDDRVGSGELQNEDEVTAPPAVYQPPVPAESNDVAPGAIPNVLGGLFERGSSQPQQSGISTGGESGSGVTQGTVGE